MKRGQAAMEFIMTYGWAILAVLAAIAALAYFGVLNPGKYAPDKCLFKTGLTCTDFLVRANGNNIDVLFTLQNSFGEAITVGQPENVTAEYKGNVQTCGPATAVTIDGGDSYAFECTALSGNPGTGQSVRVELDFSYRKTAGTYIQRSIGEITTTVQE